MDEPIVWYEGTGTADRRFLSADERGSIISVTDSSGTVLGINRYDEFGQPQSANLGAWGYTGQAWLPTLGLWYYKARVYESELGRFLQPDPIGYWDSPNLYAYVLNDPVNFTDPLGLAPTMWCGTVEGVGGYTQCFLVGGGLQATGASVGGSASLLSLVVQRQPPTGPDPGSGGEQAEPPSCNQQLVNVGNTLARASEGLAFTSTVLTGVGLSAAGQGALTLNRNRVQVGLATAAAGGALGIGAAGLQIGAGVAQGLGGAGWSNFWRGSFILATGLGIARLVGGSKPIGYQSVSQRREYRALQNLAIITGGIYDVATATIPNLTAAQRSCP